MLNMMMKIMMNRFFVEQLVEEPDNGFYFSFFRNGGTYFFFPSCFSFVRIISVKSINFV